MEQSSFPYGPPPAQLEALAQSLARNMDKPVSLTRLERLGVPKTQLSIALSGLKLLGLLDDEARPTERCKNFALKGRRSSTCEAILADVYRPLSAICRANPDGWETECVRYLNQRGKGDSAQRKILKLFAYFWEAAAVNGKHQPQMPIAAPPGADAEYPNTVLPAPMVAEGAPPYRAAVEVAAAMEQTGTTAQPTEALAAELVQSLLRYCEAQEAMLTIRQQDLTRIQAECEQLQTELARNRSQLEDYFRMYPGIRPLLAQRSGPSTVLKE